MLFMPLSVIYLELMFRIYYLACHSSGLGNFLGRYFGAGFWLSILFGAAAGCLFTLFSTFGKQKTNRVVSLVLLGATSVMFMVYAVYHCSFGTIMKLTLAADTGATAITDFLGNTISAIFSMLWLIILLAVPFALLCIFGRSYTAKHPHSKKWHLWFDKPAVRYEKYPGPAKVILVLLFAVMQLIPWGIVMLTNATTGLRAQYTSAFEVTGAAEKFGLITTARREVAIALGISKADVVVLPEDVDGSAGSSASQEPETVYKPNVMDIDFDSLIANETDTTIVKMHKYFKDRTPTKQNEYTGIFKDYNLVMITAEGFSPYAISKELTPTLYKMQTEGFRFPNFYTAGYDDTTTGEFVHTTGLIPSNNVANNLKRVKGHWLPFTMGNQYRKLGVRTYAYHPHTYTYYARNETHPTLGYDVYRGNRGGVVDGKESGSYGLTLEHPKWWPESDLEAVESTASEYIGKGMFHAYYMSVSGHKDYSFSDNMMSYKNRELVKGLPYSEINRAYIAANIELDRALESLMNKLKTTGQLEKTVFCITPDHKPQELTNEQVEEMAGRKLDDEFEIYRSVFLLYCPGYHDAVEITAPANSIDIIPTVSNLLGLEYDSRLLFGRDLLDPDAEQVITFRTRSWISSKGRYHFRTKQFTPADGVTFPSDAAKQEYIDRVNNMVSNKFAMSELVITEDYYKRVIDKW